MKTVLQALFCSLLIHILYFFSIFGWPYIQTIIDKLDRGGRYVAESHTEVMFGILGSPVVFFGTSFFGIAAICGILIMGAKKLLKT